MNGRILELSRCKSDLRWASSALGENENKELTTRIFVDSKPLLGGLAHPILGTDLFRNLGI